MENQEPETMQDSSDLTKSTSRRKLLTLIYLKVMKTINKDRSSFSIKPISAVNHKICRRFTTFRSSPPLKFIR